MKNNFDPEQPIKYSGDGGFFNGLVVGTALGAAAYFLFATEKGKKIKDELVELSKEHFPELKEAINSLKDEGIKTAQKMEKAAVQTQEILPQVKEEISAELKQLEDSVADAKKRADQMQKDLQSTASKLEKKFFFKKGRSLKK